LPESEGHVGGQVIYVLATTLEETEHALALAQGLTKATHDRFAVIVPLPERITVSSARAHVSGVAVEDAEHPDPALTVADVRALIDRFDPSSQILVTRGVDAANLRPVLPPGATVVICGPMHRFFETPEQRVARQLSNRGFDVVFHHS